jgi:hypothetical protein
MINNHKDDGEAAKEVEFIETRGWGNWGWHGFELFGELCILLEMVQIYKLLLKKRGIMPNGIFDIG